MKIFNLYILSTCLTITFSFLIMEKTFSQTSQGQRMDTTQSEPYVKGVTAGRAKSLVSVVLGLTSLITGWRMRGYSAVNASRGRMLTIAGLGLGLVAIVLSISHLANSGGGFGTGGGKAGAIVALALGLTGATLSGLALGSKRK
jgi:hypothetical protein